MRGMDKSIRLMGDARRFKQCIINLVKNSLKFTLKGGRIDVKLYYDYRLSELVVHVTDDGVGISAKDIPNLFTKFGKLQRTAKMNSTGIGLGLTIVK